MASPRDLVKSAMRALDLLHELEDGHAATDEQRAVLQAWPGWGVLAPAFDPEPSGMWLEVADRLDSLLVDTARAAAADVVDTAFYTPQPVAAHLWQVLTSAGFTGGQVLDLGCGHGALMDAAPAGMPVDFTGVEVDPTSARIAAALHPSATIYTDRLQSRSLRDNHYDAVVANVPFSSVHVHDAAYEFHAPLHTYFLRRAVRAVRPGGYVVVITSRFVMDSGNSLRELSREANLVAALRLPTGTFPGTDVVADVLVFQVRGDGVPRAGWCDSVNYEVIRSAYGIGSSRVADRRDVVDVPVIEGATVDAVRVNKYWAEHPGHVVGVMRTTGNRYNGLAVLADDPAAAAAQVFAAVCPMLPPIPTRPVPQLDDVLVADAQGRKERSFHLADGEVVTVTDGVLVQVPRPSRELRSLIGLRDAAVALMDLEADPDLPADDIAATRALALDLYTEYVASWGPLNRCTVAEGKPDPDTGVPALSVRRPAMGGFRRDPDYPLVMALEQYNPDSGEARPAAILLRRVNKRPVRIERVDTAPEALSVTLGECGRLDLSRVASLLGLDDEDAAAAALGDLVFQDPQSCGRWTPARTYLSGNVRAKLAAARAAADRDAAYTRNVAALDAVMPAQLDENDVRVNLGAPWLTPDDVAAFLREEFEAKSVSGILHTPSLAL